MYVGPDLHAQRGSHDFLVCPELPAMYPPFSASATNLLVKSSLELSLEFTVI